MPTFAYKQITAVVGKQVFQKLVVDEVCQLDEFEAKLESQYKAELIGIYSTMNDVANLLSVPKTKFHFYDKAKGEYREFEFKSKHLRIYGITIPNGKLLIFGGTKSNQRDDETKFRNIKKKYLDSLV